MSILKRTRFLALLNTAFLVVVLVIQGVWRQRLQTLKMDLPYHTGVVLGPILPVLLGVLLLMNVAARFVLAERYIAGWEVLVIVLLGIVAGYFIVGLFFPYASGPDRLT